LIDVRQRLAQLLYVKNWVDFLILCTHHPKAANQTFLLSDGEDVSTTQLLQQLARAQGAPSRLLPVPSSWLQGAMRLLGKADMAQRLLGNLQVDSTKARELLGWTPPFGFEAGVADMFAGNIMEAR
jgi:UDP-4-keto-D-QuiNAc 4-reductase